MKKNLLILAVICLFIGLSASAAAAQNYNRIRDQKINLVKGKKVILKGEVRDSDEVAYFFKVRPDQLLSVKVTGRDADFVINAVYDSGATALTDDVKSWNGRLPEDDFEKIEIVVHSNYKVADFQLEILLR